MAVSLDPRRWMHRAHRHVNVLSSYSAGWSFCLRSLWWSSWAEFLWTSRGMNGWSNSLRCMHGMYALWATFSLCCWDCEECIRKRNDKHNLTTSPRTETVSFQTTQLMENAGQFPIIFASQLGTPEEKRNHEFRWSCIHKIGNKFK